MSLFLKVLIGVALLAVSLAVVAAWQVHDYRVRKTRILLEARLPSVLESSPCTGGPSVYLLGDSNVVHWPLTCGPGWTLFRSGYAGQASANIVVAASHYIEELRPDVLIFIAGGNDLSAIALLPEEAREREIDRSLAAFRQVLHAATLAGVKRVFVPKLAFNRRNWMVRRLVWGNPGGGVVDELNAGISALCTDHCSVLDFAQIIGLHSDQDWRRYTDDGVHFNAAAYEKLAAAINRMLP